MDQIVKVARWIVLNLIHSTADSWTIHMWDFQILTIVSYMWALIRAGRTLSLDNQGAHGNYNEETWENIQVNRSCGKIGLNN